jgi:uncharacterized protein (TIGR02145 family)
MKNIVRLFLIVIVVTTCLLSSSCTQSDDLVFLNNETAIDVDGNEYRTLTINGQVWMAENLRTTRYRNGDLINPGPINKNSNEFFDLSNEYEPKYQWPSGGREMNVPILGRLYTWYAAMDSRNICPLGWHLPTDAEWEAMRSYLTENDYGRYDKKGNRKDKAAIGIALASDYSNWAGPNHSTSFSEDVIGTDYTEHNTTGFSAYPAGCYFGDFVQIGFLSIWRSTSPNNSWNLNFIGTTLQSGLCYFYKYPLLNFGTKPYDGYSVRCVKDRPNSTLDADTSHNGVILLTITYPTTLSSRAAKLYVDITSDGGSRVTERGVCWSTSPNPTTSLQSKTLNGAGKGMFVNELNGLSIATKYYVRAYASNDSGTYYSNEISFSTKNSSIELTTMDAAAVSNSSATLRGSIINKDSVEITSKGFCWSTVPNPTIDLTTKTNDGSGSDNFSSKIIGLNPSIKYYVRAYVVSSIGTIYGNEIQFETGLSDPIMDVCGNIYHYIKIGSQTWMLENLKTTKYRDGTPIPLIQESLNWLKLTSGAYANYANDSRNTNTYGQLYNWYAVCDSRNIAPKGWHVATVDEWRTLINYLGGLDVAIFKLKETGTTHWVSPNSGATNECGFSALPGGYCNENLNFMNIGDMGYWWGYTQDYSSMAWYFRLYSPITDISNIYDGIFIITSKTDWRYGMSVRCVKDE